MDRKTNNYAYATRGLSNNSPVSDEIIHFRASDYLEAFDSFQQHFIDWGWSDGITLVPPTQKKVEWMLTGQVIPLMK